MPESTPASAGPRVSDEELARYTTAMRLSPRPTMHIGTLPDAPEYSNTFVKVLDVACDLADCRTALAAANARIAVLEGVDEDLVQRFVEGYQRDGVKPEWAAKSLVPQLEQSVEKWRKRYHGTRAMHVAAQRIALFATASPEPGVAHE
jgi:hypothetical protein